MWSCSLLGHIVKHLLQQAFSFRTDSWVVVAWFVRFDFVEYLALRLARVWMLASSEHQVKEDSKRPDVSVVRGVW